MTRVMKVTIVPVGSVVCEWDENPLPAGTCPYDVGGGVYFTEISSLVKTADFTAWMKNGMMAKREADEILGWKYALVHNFESESTLQAEIEKTSADLVQKVASALRIICPFRTPSAVLQAEMTNDTIDPFNFLRSSMPTLSAPEGDRHRLIHQCDLAELRVIAPHLLRAYQSGYTPIVSAVHLMEAGYHTFWPSIQQLVWVTGLDALFTSPDPPNRGTDVAVSRISDFLGLSYPIYRTEDFPSYMPPPACELRQVIADVYRFRHCHAHGSQPPKKWTNVKDRQGISGTISYADLLWQCSSTLLRASLAKIFRDDLLHVFGTKLAMNGYFTSRGVTKRRSMERFC